MATREESNIRLACKCGNEGWARCSEKDHPWGPSQFMVEEMSEGFQEVAEGGDNRLDFTVRCSKCGEKFKA